jgi:nitronate monooxygenase
MLVESTAEDIVMSDKLTGVKANFMRQSLAANGLDPKAAASDRLAEKGFGEGGSSYKAWRDVWSAGHGAGAVNQLRPTADIVAVMAEDYSEARRALL